jgi:hypothetical protein
MVWDFVGGSPVPEPSTWAMMIPGSLGWGQWATAGGVEREDARRLTPDSVLPQAQDRG